MAQEKKVKKSVKPPKKLGEFQLVNHEKFRRVVEGVLGPNGKMVGGLGKDAPVADVIAAYDKLGGLILDAKNRKLEAGCFWNFAEGVKRAKPVVELRRKDVRGGVVVEDVDDEGEAGTQPKEKGVVATEGAKALAEEHNIDLAEVEGSGAEGKILKADVEALINAAG